MVFTEQDNAASGDQPLPGCALQSAVGGRPCERCPAGGTACRAAL